MLYSISKCMHTLCAEYSVPFARKLALYLHALPKHLRSVNARHGECEQTTLSSFPAYIRVRALMSAVCAAKMALPASFYMGMPDCAHLHIQHTCTCIKMMTWSSRHCTCIRVHARAHVHTHTTTHTRARTHTNTRTHTQIVPMRIHHSLTLCALRIRPLLHWVGHCQGATLRCVCMCVLALFARLLTCSLTKHLCSQHLWACGILAACVFRCLGRPSAKC